MKQWIWKISWDSLPVLFACPEFTTNSYPHWATPDVPYGDTHILVRGRDFGKCCCKNHLPFWSFDTRFACHWGSIFSFITVGSYQPKKTSNIQNHCVNHHITHTDTHTFTTIDSIDCLNFWSHHACISSGFHPVLTSWSQQTTWWSPTKTSNPSPTG